jgi:hypothetical protein
MREFPRSDGGLESAAGHFADETPKGAFVPLGRRSWDYAEEEYANQVAGIGPCDRWLLGVG